MNNYVYIHLRLSIPIMITKSVSVQSSMMEKCKGLVDGGEFENFSDIVNFSMRLFLYSIRKGDVRVIEHMVRRNPERTSVKVDAWVFEGLLGTGKLVESEITDYSLAYFLKWREGTIDIDDVM